MFSKLRPFFHPNYHPGGIQCARLVVTCVKCESINIECNGGSYSKGVVWIGCNDCNHEWDEPECPKMLGSERKPSGTA